MKFALNREWEKQQPTPAQQGFLDARGISSRGLTRGQAYDLIARLHGQERQLEQARETERRKLLREAMLREQH